MVVMDVEIVQDPEQSNLSLTDAKNLRLTA